MKETPLECLNCGEIYKVKHRKHFIKFNCLNCRETLTRGRKYDGIQVNHNCRENPEQDPENIKIIDKTK